MGGLTIPKDEHISKNTIVCVYGGKYSPLKHELMHLISSLKWGSRVSKLIWLSEGLVVYANPETFDCDGHTLEERYIYFLHSGKLLDLNTLLYFPDPKEKSQNKIAYNQSGYIVEYLIENYGIEKIRLFWTKGMDEFENIFAGYNSQNE